MKTICETFVRVFTWVTPSASNEQATALVSVYSKSRCNALSSYDQHDCLMPSMTSCDLRSDRAKIRFWTKITFTKKFRCWNAFLCETSQRNNYALALLSKRKKNIYSPQQKLKIKLTFNLNQSFPIPNLNNSNTISHFDSKPNTNQLALSISGCAVRHYNYYHSDTEKTPLSAPWWRHSMITKLFESCWLMKLGAADAIYTAR